MGRLAFPALALMLILAGPCSSMADGPPGMVLSSMAKILYHSIQGMFYREEPPLPHANTNPWRTETSGWTRLVNDSTVSRYLGPSFAPSKHRRPALLSMFPGSPKQQHPLLGGPELEGEPFILTPLIEAGKLNEARQGSMVDQNLFRIPSHSGFFTVSKEYSSNLFFWYIPAKENPDTAPLVIWLQGGPGGSSMFGMFVEHGPFSVSPNLTLVEREYSWANKYNMLYFDQPVGTGFSFTKDPRGLAKDQEDVSRDLYEALTQFYQVFPERLRNDLYVTGESYGGKYVPAISYKIHKMNQAGRKGMKIPLKGLAIGDGLCDPLHQMDYGDFLFQVGLLDENDRDTLLKMSSLTKHYITTSQWEMADEMFDRMMSFFGDKSGLSFVYNFLLDSQPDSFTYYPNFLVRPDVRKAIHAGGVEYGDINETVYKSLSKDIPKSVSYMIETLLDANYKVMIYSGQMDVIIAHPQTENFIAALNWRGSGAYRQADRKIWTVGGRVAGYSREVKNLKQVMVRNSGHILPYDQPEWAYDMIQRFIENRPFY